MSTLRYALAVGAVLVAVASPADAQLRRVGTIVVPDGSTMPSGVCRIWIDGLPASRQPAPTDCETARRNRPRNGRIIYGTAQRTSDNGRWQRERAERERAERERERQELLRRQERDRLEQQRRAEREREHLARKQEKEREKEWKREHRGNGRYRNGNDHDGRRDDDDRDDDRDDDHRGRRDHDDRRSTVQQGCIDANRDGICDAAQRTTQTLPVPQTIPSTGGTNRVCVDANRDGRCDDGGPLIRRTP